MGGVVRFKIKYGAGPNERWSEQAARSLAGQKTAVIYEGTRHEATIAGAEVEDGGGSVTITFDVADGTDLAVAVSPLEEFSVVSTSCERKIAFPDERAAKDELARIIKRSMTGDRVRRSHIETGYYECPTCTKWHLSSRPWDGNVRNERRSS